MFSDDLTNRANALLEACRSRKLKVVTAESCTSGLLATLLTQAPGSSDMFEGGYVTYSNDMKHTQLDVSYSLLDQFGAVSSEVAQAMAEGALKNSPGRVAISITGIAGPGGGSEDKPVGLVFIGSARQSGHCIVRRFLFEGDRHQVRMQSVDAALGMLEYQIAQKP